MKKHRKHNSFSIAIQNIRFRKYRSLLMFLFVMIMSATFFFSTFVTDSLESRIEKTTGRLGADMIVTAAGAQEELSRSLFAGQPCTLWFDFDEDSFDAILGLEGVEEASPQLFIGSLDASCCSSPSQLVAIDPDSDFMVSSWLSGDEDLALEKGEVIVGDGIINSEGQNIRFFNTEFKIVKKLDRTGMGYDNSVFMTYETAEMLMDSKEARENMDVGKIADSASMIMVKMVEGTNDLTLKGEILRTALGKYKVFTASSLMGELQGQIERLAGYGRLLTAILVIATALALICIFIINMNERREEFGIMYAIGASNTQISGIIFSEAIIISVAGGVIGALISAGLIAAFKDILSVMMNVPGFELNVSQIIGIGAFGIGLTVITGIIAAAISVYRISRGEPYRLIREGR